MTTEPALLLEVNDLQTHFTTEEGTLRAVDGVSFKLARGARWPWSVSLAAARA